MRAVVQLKARRAFFVRADKGVAVGEICEVSPEDAFVLVGGGKAELVNHSDEEVIRAAVQSQAARACGRDSGARSAKAW